MTTFQIILAICVAILMANLTAFLCIKVCRKLWPAARKSTLKWIGALLFMVLAALYSAIFIR